MGAALLIAAPQALGVDRHHAPRRTEAELLPERAHEGRKGARKLRRIKQPEHPREGVVRGRPMRQRNQRRKLLGVAVRKLGLSKQLLAPHSVAAKARNRTDAKSWRAFTSRGSWTSRKIEIKLAIRALPKEESPFENPASKISQHSIPPNAIPLPTRGEGKCAPAL